MGFGSAILATFRRHQNHGKFNGNVEDQIHILEKAIEAGAQAVKELLFFVEGA